jgi:tetratricopeptide (TPR) repeat protein
LRLAAASWRYWRSSGQFERGRSVARVALAHAGVDAEPLPQCRLLNGLATLVYYMGRHDESKALAAEALAVARRIGDLTQIASALVLLTYGKKADADPEPILASYEEIRGIAAGLGDKGLMARNLNNLAEWHRLRGMSADAAACYEEALALHREAETPGMITVVLCNYARLRLGQGDAAQGGNLLGEAFTLTRAHGLSALDTHVLEVGAALAALRAEPEQAARLHGASLARLHDGGAKRDSLDEAFLTPLLARARAALGAAAYDAAERAGAALARETALDDLGVWLASPRDDP